MTSNPSTTVPRVITSIGELRAVVRKSHLAGEQVGLVPTMGALHAGHLSLVDASRRDCQLTVVSIFVNPTQFGPGEDFTRYPRTLNADLRLLADRGADVVFAPDTAAVYRPGNATKVEVAGPALNLEGAFRPTHFSGVATIVLKLFNLVQPDKAYFGRKDFQQSLVVQRMADDLDLPIEVVVCPIIREPDGLAMSSRNIYLSADERQRALAISQALQGAVARVANGEHDSAKLIAEMEAQLKRADLQIDYVAIAARDTLEPLPHVDRPAVALIAARCGATRLIDNELLG